MAIGEHEGDSTVVARRHAVPAWLLSVLLHFSLLLALVFTVRNTPRGAAVEPDRSAGIVLAKRTSDPIEYFDGDVDVEIDVEQESVAESTDLPLPLEEFLSADIADALPDTRGPAVSNLADGGLLPGANSLTQGRPPPKRFGGSVQTSVFGVTGTGSKFVYVFDRSASMENFNSRPLAAAKKEMIASIEELDDIHQFQIIFYNEQPAVFNPAGASPRMWWGDARGKQLAKRFVGGIIAVGGTEHMPALEMALRLKPDVIFFLSDADEPRLTAPQLARLRRLNSGTASIHAIEFGYGPNPGRDNFLQRLAGQNDGRHAYVDVSRWGR